jgi:hypothetical protein
VGLASWGLEPRQGVGSGRRDLEKEAEKRRKEEEKKLLRKTKGA